MAFLILSQIINSNLTETEAIGEHSLEGFITWMHIISGLGLIICGFIMLRWMLTQRGFTYYFSWVWLDFSGIKQDIKTLTSLRLPNAHSGGIASDLCSGAYPRPPALGNRIFSACDWRSYPGNDSAGTGAPERQLSSRKSPGFLSNIYV